MDTLKEVIRNISRLGKPVKFLDRTNTEPVSRVFGTDRGKPIDRFYIEKFLAPFSPHLSGILFEIGEKKYSASLKAEEKPVKSYSVGLADGVDFKLDLSDGKSAPPFPADAFICTQTLNFIFPLHETIQGLRRCIRPGGLLIGTVGGISSVSSYDERRWGHYWGFTPQSIHSLFPSIEWKDLQVTVFGNYFSAQAFLSGLAYEDLLDPSWLDPVDRRYPVVIGFSAIRI